ncbi:zinc finger CCCH domain-containing protein 7-like [Vicia villosa]|uniref:zinc finger CCCH domain-containing protein 7-like n=1 Tax=Vicia villosa TaxID=3911 RepID=UPI00273A82CC|nr:zinc finger CCCH domain-containing protein 7-like [Vicia villosa]
MPNCSYFLQGLCSNKSCSYRHVNVNSNASICEGFLKGYCADRNELKINHTISSEILINPGYVLALNVKYRVFHYGLQFSVGNWSFDKAGCREIFIGSIAFRMTCYMDAVI